jgi:hypothetical protein
MHTVFMSPVVYQFDGIKVRIHKGDHNPPHVHVEGKGHEARFDLRTLELISNDGFSRADIVRVRSELEVRALSLREIWDAYNE